MNAPPTHEPPPPNMHTYAHDQLILHIHTFSDDSVQLCVHFIFWLMCNTAHDTNVTHPPIPASHLTPHPPPHTQNLWQTASKPQGSRVFCCTISCTTSPQWSDEANLQTFAINYSNKSLLLSSGNVTSSFFFFLQHKLNKHFSMSVSMTHIDLFSIHSILYCLQG